MRPSLLLRRQCWPRRQEAELGWEEAMREEAQLHREIALLEQEREDLNESLLRLQEEVRRSFEERTLTEQALRSHTAEVRRLLGEEDDLAKDVAMMEKELAYLQQQHSQCALRLNELKAKYLLVDHAVNLDEDELPAPEQDVLGKRCKFYPSELAGSQQKFMFEDFEGGFLVRKVSPEIGFTVLPHRFAFPSEGRFHFTFELREIQRNDLLIGLSSGSEPRQSLYFNFASGRVELDGRTVQLDGRAGQLDGRAGQLDGRAGQLAECELALDSLVLLVVDMDRKCMVCCVDHNFHSVVSFEPYGLDPDRVSMFLGVSSRKTLIYFSNS